MSNLDLQKFHRALSLYEFLIVFAIISMMAAISLPILQSYSPTLKLNGSARGLVNKLRQAQEEAITIQKQHLIRINPTSSPVSYQLIKIDGGESVLETENMAKDVIIALDPSISDNQIIFSSDGGPSVSGNITLTLNSSSRVINISPAGVIKLQ